MNRIVSTIAVTRWKQSVTHPKKMMPNSAYTSSGRFDSPKKLTAITAAEKSSASTPIPKAMNDAPTVPLATAAGWWL